MHYAEFSNWLSQSIERASEQRRMAFAQQTLQQVITAPIVNDIDWDGELDENARNALRSAMTDTLSTPSAELRAHLESVDAGVLTDGDVDPCLLQLIDAIAAWTAYLDTQKMSDLLLLANMAVEQIDFQVEAPLDDFLSSQEMRAERDRIAACLAA